MATVPDGYPHGLTDEQILEALEAIGDDLRRGGYSINAAMQYGPVIALGQNELQARIAKRGSAELRDAIDTFRSSSDTASTTLIRLTRVLVFLTVVLIALTVVLLAKG